MTDEYTEWRCESCHGPIFRGGEPLCMVCQTIKEQQARMPKPNQEHQTIEWVKLLEREYLTDPVVFDIARSMPCDLESMAVLVRQLCKDKAVLLRVAARLQNDTIPELALNEVEV
jgi:hypothetical protein